MPAAGRPVGKYVRKVHFGPTGFRPLGMVRTRCGKTVQSWQASLNPRKVTCKTCLLILDIPVGELDGVD